MRLRKSTFSLYVTARKAIRAAGLIRPVRTLIGPAVGRLVFRISTDVEQPVEVLGHKMYLAPPGGYPPMDMVAGKYEPQTTRLFSQLARPGMSVVDVGAHVGYYSLLAAKKVGPTGHVFAFEPEPMNYDLLVKNAKLNGYQNIVAVQKAASRREGTAKLYLTALDNGRHSVYDHNLPQAGSRVVETTTVDALLEEHGWPAVSLVKIDVEGAELDVMAGMERVLRESKDLKLIMEFNPSLLRNAGVDLVKFLEIPARWQFEVYCIDEKAGVSPLKATDMPAMVDRLLAAESSVNLFCTR